MIQCHYSRPDPFISIFPVYEKCQNSKNNSITFRMQGIKHLLNGRKLPAFCFLILLTSVALTIIYSKYIDRDQIRYHRLARQIQLDIQTTVANGRMTPSSYKASHYRMMQYNQLETKLLASGFLTNLSITLSPTDSTTNNSSELVNVIDSRLQNLLPNDFLPAQIDVNVQSNTVLYEIICPTSDVPLIKEVVRDEINKMDQKTQRLPPHH